MNVRIRPERGGDHAAVRAVNETAFDSPAEANLVALLREAADPVVSLVAEADGKIVGHILFSPMTLDGHPEARIMGLAPMAVAPGHQRRGVGSALVKAGLAQCQRLEYGAVVVLGHPDYYPRFGFVPASRYSLSGDYDVPDDVFMALELQEGYLAKFSGKVHYHRAFNAL